MNGAATYRRFLSILPALLSVACGARSTLREPRALALQPVEDASAQDVPWMVDQVLVMDVPNRIDATVDVPEINVVDVPTPMDGAMPPPPAPRACPYEPQSPTIQLQTPGSAQLDSLLYRAADNSFIVAYLSAGGAQDIGSVIQSFATNGVARSQAVRSIVRDQGDWIASRTLLSTSGPSLFALAIAKPMDIESSFVVADLIGANGQRRASSLRESDFGLGPLRTINTLNGFTHVLTVRGFAEQTLQVLSYPPGATEPQFSNRFQYSNGVGSYAAIAPSGRSNVIAVWGTGAVDSTVTIHAKRFVGSMQEQEQVLDQFTTFRRPAVFAAGSESATWGLWARPTNQLWAAKTAAGSNEFSRPILLANNLAINEGVAVVQHNAEMVLVASEPSDGGGGVENIRLVTFDQSTGGVTQDVIVDRMPAPLRFAVVSQDPQTFTVAWTSVIDQAGNDPRIFLRTYRAACQ